MSPSSTKRSRPALGMGLDALLPDRLEGEYFLCPVEEVRPSSHQPRQHFDVGTIEELAQSIREKGLIQPVILRRDPGGGYELIAGERRWRAAQKAGLSEVPAILREAADEEILEMALVENLQREDLDPVEEARAYRVLIERMGLTQEELGERIGKSRVAIANALRLLALPDPILDALRSRAISAGHARAILAVEGEEERSRALEHILRRGLSVRQAERFAGTPTPKKQPASPRDSNLRELEERLTRDFGTRVTVKPGRKKGSGKISIEFRNLDDLDRILALVPSSGKL